MTTDIKQNYKIYIACIGAYNSGHLVGRWADLEHDNYDDVVKDIKAECLKSSKGQGYLNCYNCEELRIDDTDGPGGFYEFVNKFFINEAFEKFAEVQGIIKTEFNGTDSGNDAHMEAFLIYFDSIFQSQDMDMREAYKIFIDSYVGLYNDWEEYADQYIDDVIGPGANCDNEICKNYFDYDKFKSDQEMDYTLEESLNNYVHIYRNN